MSLEWAGAEVKDGVLTVPLTGELPEGWHQTFQMTVRLLRSGGWEDVEIADGKVRVTGVSAGMEERLHQFLEGAVQQADAEHKSTQDETEKTDGAADADSDDPDAELTARFRAFAE